MLDLDGSLFFITVLLIFLYVIADRLFFRPVGGILDRRESKAAADSESLARILEEIETHTRTLETRHEETRKEASRIQEEFVRRGDEIRRHLVEEAKENSQRLLQERLDEMERQLVDAERELTLQIETFSAQIRESLL